MKPQFVYNHKKTTEVVGVSTNLPEQVKGWRGPFCPAALPEGLSKYQAEVARKRRFQSKHTKGKINKKTIFAAGMKQVRKNPDTFLQWKQKRLTLQAALSRKTVEDPDLNGHKLRVFTSDWTQRPGTRKSAISRTLVTCLKCLRMARADSWNRKACVGRHGQRNPVTIKQWVELTKGKTANSNLSILLPLWKLSFAEADALIRNLPVRENAKRSDSRLGDHRNERIGEAAPRPSQCQVRPNLHP